MRLVPLPRSTLEDAAGLRAAFERHSHGTGCAVAAVLLEPVCSQSGSRLTAATSATLRTVCDAHRVPIISDETRSGLMRCCGALLAAPSLGLVPDLATIGESLGGGFASVAAVVYDRRTFGRTGFPSSATMVNDNLSSHVALGVLGHLQSMAAEYGEAAAHFERSVRAALSTGGHDGQTGGCAAVCEVHGCGLMLALRFHTHVLVELGAVANELRPVTCAGVPPALLLHAYLLREHGVRARPTECTPQRSE